ncbi:hypothetical protein BAC3_01992 [uncultured bacterium]|nr:hypothetical protein BAC3_01992 [uncultured bacterium]
MIDNKLIRNTGFVFVAGIVNKLFSLVAIAYTARVLGKADFGFYTLIGTFTFLFSYFGNFGIGPMTIKEISRNKTKVHELFNHIISLRLCLIVFSFPILILIVNLLDYREDIKYLILIAGFSSLFSTFSDSFNTLYIAFERFKVPSLISVLISFLSSISNILILYFGYGLKGIVMISFIGALLGAVVSGLWVRQRFFKYKFAFNFHIWKDLIYRSLPFSIVTFLQQGRMYLNILFLSKLPGPLPGEVAIGYYYPASSLCQVALMLSNSFRQAALPTMASNASDIKIIQRIINKSTKVLLFIVILPLIIFTTFFPEKIITIIYGNEYLPSASTLTILGWAYAFMIFNTPVTVALFAVEEIRGFIPWAILLFCINIALIVPLILNYSFLGVAIAFLISGIIDTVVRNYLLRTFLGIKNLKIGDVDKENIY